MQGPIWLYNLNCSELEQGILNCSVINLTSSDCNHYYAPGAKCIGKSYLCYFNRTKFFPLIPASLPPQNCTDGDVRLVGSPIPSEGLVESIGVPSVGNMVTSLHVHIQMPSAGSWDAHYTMQLHMEAPLGQEQEKYLCPHFLSYTMMMQFINSNKQ